MGIIKILFFTTEVYCKKLFCYTDNINGKSEYQRGDQMNAAQRIQLTRIIEKIEKNPEFSNKLGVKNTSDFISDKQRKNESLTTG